MKTYIRCNNKAERDAVLKAMDKKGIRWINGRELPTEWEFDEWEDNDTVYLTVHGDDSLSWSYISFGYDKDNDEMVTASEYLAKARNRKPILIYRKGREVTAEDKNTGETGKAVCSPDDEFDFHTGAMIALCRLVGDGVGDDAKAEMRKLIGEEPKSETDDFNVGDRVEIKSWGEMEKEYGAAMWGDISHGDTCFCDSMKHLCGRTATITAIDDERYFLDFDDKSGDVEWYYCDWMFNRTDKPKPEVTEIKVGDAVRIIRNGCAYTSYIDWIHDNVINFRNAVMYDYNVTPRNGMYCTVVKKGKHPLEGNMLYYVKTDNDKCYLMGEDGIEKV